MRPSRCSPGPRAPQEVRIAFDRPLDPAGLRDLAGKIAIEYGRAVRPGDRFESLRPGYEVVARQMRMPRFAAADPLDPGLGRPSLAAPGTAPHPEASSYAITLPRLAAPSAGKPAPGGSSRRSPTVDLGYDLLGRRARPGGPTPGDGGWSGWLPHLDLAVARAFTAAAPITTGSGRRWNVRAGSRSRTKLDLWQMLRPAVQPGSTTGYTLPDEEVTLIFSGAVADSR